jgi:peptidoglycan L-alanyl-D-glutamate endopeptidase CwlK
MSGLKFGKRSRRELETCNPILTTIAYSALSASIIDFTVLCGHREEEEQNKAFERGVTLVKWPNSKHNSLPSLAVDVIPYPLKSWEDLEEFAYMAGIIIATAKHLDIKIRWGGHFKNFKDMPHFELVEVTSQSGTKSEITPKEHLPSGPSDQEIKDKLKSKES